MKKNAALCLLLVVIAFSACKKSAYTGFVLNRQNNKPLKGVTVIHFNDSTTTDSLGYFSLPPNESAGQLIFKMPGFYTDTAETVTIHSGEVMEQNFKGEKIYLFPVSGKFRNIQEALNAQQPAPIDTGVIFSSAQTKEFYSRDKMDEYNLVAPNGYAISKYDGLIIPVKSSHFDYNIKPGSNYITVKSLLINRIPCRLIAFTTPGENDTQVLGFQLNSYDNNNHIQDALQLDSRFTFEIEYYSEFSIHGDGRILIDRYSVDNLKQNEDGDIIGEKAKPDTVVLQDYYQLNDKGQLIEKMRLH